MCVCVCVCVCIQLGFPGGSDGKESACIVGDLGSIPRSGKSTGEVNDMAIHLLGEFLGQRSLAGHSPLGHQRSYMTDRFIVYIYIYIHIYFSHIYMFPFHDGSL